jgi:hypothetical protein
MKSTLLLSLVLFFHFLLRVSSRVANEDQLNFVGAVQAFEGERREVAAIEAENMGFFAGGWDKDNEQPLDDVEIVDFTTFEWSHATLSEARSCITVARVNNYVLFAGGSFETSCTYMYSTNVSNRVDIYNLETKTWSQAALSERKFGMSVAVVGELAIFYGGQQAIWAGTPILYYCTHVEIFNSTDATWTYVTIDELDARKQIVGASIGELAMFAGGERQLVQSEVVFIYNSSSGEWRYSCDFPRFRY